MMSTTKDNNDSLPSSEMSKSAGSSKCASGNDRLAGDRVPKFATVEMAGAKRKMRQYLKVWAKNHDGTPWKQPFEAQAGDEPLNDPTVDDSDSRTREWMKMGRIFQRYNEKMSEKTRRMLEDRALGRLPFDVWFKTWRKEQDSTQVLNMVVKLAEDLYILYRLLGKARDREDRILALTTFVKLRHQGSLAISVGSALTTYFMELFPEGGMEAQSGEFLSFARSCLDKWEEVKNSPIYKKVYRLTMFAMATSLFAGLGLSMNRMGYNRAEQESLKREYHMGPDFIMTILDSVLFICERGQQCMKTGSLDPLFHSGKSYDAWYEQALKIQQLSQFVSNLEPHGYTIYQFVSELRELIEKGDAVIKHASRIKECDPKFLHLMMQRLKLIQSDVLTRKAAMQDRSAPFSILLHGGTSVNKSALTKCLFYHYGKLFGLPTSADYKYTRNSIDEYWTNFNTSQWCVQLDDIAFMNPQVATQGDPTLMEMLQVVNNVPFVPIQAALEDKGRTPLLSRFVIATTNTKHLNVNAYFSCPVAVARRLPWIATVEPKGRFRNEDGTFNTAEAALYSDRLEEGEYPDFWSFVIHKVKATAKNSKVVGRPNDKDERIYAIYEEKHRFQDIYTFVSWFSTQALEYEKTQQAACAVDAKMSKVELCKGCHLPILHCRCTTANLAQVVSQLEELESKAEEDVGVLEPIPEDELEDYYLQEFYAQAGDHDNDFGPGTYEIPWRVDTMHSTWSALKEHVIEDGKAIFMETVNESWSNWFIVWFWTLLYLLYRYCAPFRMLIQRWYGNSWMYRKILSLGWEKRVVRRSIYKLGDEIEKHVSSHNYFKKIALAIAGGGAMYLAYRAFKSMYGFGGMDAQGNTHSTPKVSERPLLEKVGRAPDVQKEKEEKQNVWYNSDIETTKFDVTPMIESYKDIPDEKLEDILIKNCVTFDSYSISGERMRNLRVKAFCIGGHSYITNNHAACEDPEFDLHVIQSDKPGVNSNIKIRVTQGMINRFPHMDLAVFILPALPPKRDLTALFASERMRGIHKGFYLGRNADGVPVKFKVDNIHPNMTWLSNNGSPILDDSGQKRWFQVWKGIKDSDTRLGDCGMILVSREKGSGFGPIILGIHCGGSGVEAAAIPVTREFCNMLKMVTAPVMEMAPPMLNAQSTTHVMGELHPKSSLRYIEKGSALIYGSILSHRSNMKSRVRPTVLCKALQARGHELKHGPPVLRGWKIEHVQLVPMLEPATKINPEILGRVTMDFLSDIRKGLSEDDLKGVYPVDIFTAINGAQGVAFVDSIKRSTSAGFPWMTTKKKFEIPIPPERGLQEPITYSDEILDRVEEILKRYDNNQMASPVFQACFKDEAVKLEKIAKHKTRIFTGSPLDFALVVRMHFLMIAKLVYEKRELFESAPGTNATSPEWGRFYSYLTKHGSDQIIAGDYGQYDKKMFNQVVRCAIHVMVTIAEWSGNYTPEALNRMRGIQQDCTYPLYNFFGDLVRFYGTNTSGNPLTVFINGFANSIYMRYCYAVLGDGTATNFKRDVSLLTYGDDNIMGVSKETPWFNHTAIAKVLESIGVEYTMADKKAESVPYVNIEDSSFLKRTWRWDEDVGAYLAPLEEDSIWKSLMIGVESRTICREAQAVEIIKSAQREYFFFGKDIFNERTQLFRELIRECGLSRYVSDHTLATWNDFYDQFWDGHITPDDLEISEF